MKNPTSHTIPTKTQRLFRRYIVAMVNFYGRITLGDAFDIIQYQNDASYDFNDFVAYAKGQRKKILKEKNQFHEFYVIMPSEIHPIFNDANLREIEFLHEVLADIDDFYQDIALHQSQHDRYIPKKSDLLRYADGSYIPESDALRKAVDWVLDHQKADLPHNLSFDLVASKIMEPILANSDPNESAKSLTRLILT